MLSEKCMPLKVTALLFIDLNLPHRFIRKTLLLHLGLANGAPLQPSSASTRRRATMYQVTIRGQVPETMKSIKAWARRLVSRSSPIHLAGASQSQAPRLKVLRPSSSGKLRSKGPQVEAITELSPLLIVCPLQMLLCTVSSILQLT